MDLDVYVDRAQVGKVWTKGLAFLWRRLYDDSRLDKYIAHGMGGFHRLLGGSRWQAHRWRECLRGYEAGHRRRYGV